MFGLTTATRIFVHTGATGMRMGFNGLYGLVQDVLREDPLSGHLFLFSNRQRTRLKVMVFDGSGLCKRMGIPVREFLADVLPGLAGRKLDEIAGLTPRALAWVAQYRGEGLSGRIGWYVNRWTKLGRLDNRFTDLMYTHGITSSGVSFVQ